MLTSIWKNLQDMGMTDGSKFSLRYYAVLQEKKQRMRMQMI